MATLANAELRSSRLAECKKCPHLMQFPPIPHLSFRLNGNGNCSKCGCFVDTKVAFTRSQCPVNRW